MQQCEVTVSTEKSRFPTDSREDRYAVPINMQSRTVFGQIPHAILGVSFMFLEHDFTISHRVTTGDAIVICEKLRKTGNPSRLVST